MRLQVVGTTRLRTMTEGLAKQVISRRDAYNLNELEAPAPVQDSNEQEPYTKRFLETARSQEQNHARDDACGPQNTNGIAGGRARSSSTEAKTSTPDPSHTSRVVTELYTLSYLILFSLLGTLARIGLEALTSYPGNPVATSVLWANFGGSLIMGFLSEDGKLFMQHTGAQWDPSSNGPKKSYQRNGHLQGMSVLGATEKAAANKAHRAIKKTIPLYIGLTTGFCGSFTSFSTFIRDVFLALSNDAPTIISTSKSSTSIIHRNGGYSFLALLAVIILTLCLSLSALQLGGHIAIATESITPALPVFLTRKVFDRATVIVAIGSWLGAVFLAIWPPDRPGGPAADGRMSWSKETWRGQAVFALVFAPLGTLARFYISLLLNGRVPSFPLGTFTVNVLGTIILGMAWDLQHVPLGSARGKVGGGLVGCQVLQGIQDGFCGCLTTVSTWVLELTGLRRKHAYFYASMSIGIALASLVVIMGSLRWTRGFDEKVCSS